MQSLPSHIARALASERIRDLRREAGGHAQTASGRRSRRAASRARAGAAKSHGGHGRDAGHGDCSGGGAAAGGQPPAAAPPPGAAGPRSRSTRPAAALRRVAATAARVVRDCRLAQRRVAILRSGVDRHLPDPETGPRTYSEFLLRTSGLLAHEPNAAARRRGQPVA